MKCYIRRFNHDPEIVDIEDIIDITRFGDILLKVSTKDAVIIGYSVSFEE